MIHADGSNLVFITGCPRSGTTWLHRLIASHPLVTTGQESNLFDFYIGPQLRTWREEYTYYDGRGPNGLHTYVTEPEFLQILRDYALALLGKVPLKNHGLFLEKTPSHVCFLREIHELFPQAKVILIQRHPVDVVASLLSAGRSWGNLWAPKNVFDAAKMWKRYVKCGITNKNYLPPLQLFETSFERIKSHGKATLKAIFDFINLECSDHDLENYFKANRPGSPTMTNIPLYGEYLGRFTVEPEGFHRRQDSDRYLPTLLKLVVNLMCLPEMRALGYRIK
jgi:hypothetical protein